MVVGEVGAGDVAGVGDFGVDCVAGVDASVVGFVLGVACLGVDGIGSVVSSTWNLFCVLMVLVGMVLCLNAGVCDLVVADFEGVVVPALQFRNRVRSAPNMSSPLPSGPIPQ